MAKQSVTITSATTVQIGTVMRRHEANNWFATFFAYGTWGGTSLAWQWSPDSGITKLAMKDLGGNAVTSTNNDSFNSEFGTGKNNSDHVQLYVTTTGGAGISLTVGFFDNQ